MVTAALGWLGTAGTFVAYLLLWRGHLGSESLTDARRNTGGGLLGGAARVQYGAWPSAASNLVWATIGLHSTISAVKRRAGSAIRARARALDVAIFDTPEDCLV